ncbi:PrcB C-terminal domain protein [Treponema socranskii subsp. socranskii VPI DR56BR1116 = ATCC 35536]|uniref:PrcB C-terminal domain protein n=1 Tax=Treponema socranskii subsp. socranskii VPI DR56BR1116 = ATCC 35536 TaxID=1125725 RepID=U2LDX6_TRESO|nr:dentilisin complex subunit PrcB [Treponema socranskii]ERF61530.1 PrcB C-terminal domain protein [Treponema socranskii subsp. socranskii VPI DR56BR1116 = ATCC 35536]ERK02688.1 PrcB C-terminal domain protein [Treponema socranskii subsp. socranskii VPI DR56BR1116 = ATCC 35536]
MRKHILLIVLSAFFLSACKSVPAKLQDGTTAPSVSYEAGGFVSAQSDKNAGLYPDAVLTGREGRVDISYEILEEGNYGAEFGTAVIENQKDLDKLYARLHDRSDRPAPKIDFERKKVIAVRSGPFTTGGYGIKLYSAIDTKDGVETVFLITAPEPTQIVTQAFTTPYLIISIDVPSSKPVFVKLQRYKPEFDL